MRILFILGLPIVLLLSFKKQSIVQKDILFAANEFKDFGFGYKKLEFKLFSDSTYIFNYRESESSHEKNEMFRGRYFIKSDTINFYPFDFRFIESDMAIIREGFIEFLNGERPLRLKIKRTTLQTKESFDIVRFKTYSFFSYNSKHYDCFSEDAQPINLDNKDLIKLDSLITACIDQNSKLISRKPTQYYKQCIAVVDSNGEKIVWINLTCSNQYYKYGIDEVNDGGDCFATLKINLTKLKFYELWVNGYG